MKKIYTVKEINEYISGLLEGDGALRYIEVQGELSNFKRYSSGHCYFDLKDASGVLKGVMWKYSFERLTFMPKNGDKIVARGSIKVYKPNGSYQLITESMEPQGRGDLMAEFEKLKAKLSAEGLFAQERKQALPENPRVVGIITSPSGAAVRDIITVSRRRNPGIKLYLYPVQVQGKGASAEIARAIRFFNQTRLAEVLVVGRGGGSLEDLWAFNEETAVRAVAASRIPVVSAVGHETDFTLCDFAADVRAATPSQAAEIAVADVEKYLKEINHIRQRLGLLLTKQLEQESYRLERCKASWVLREPWRLYEAYEERLQRALQARVLQEPQRLYAHYEERLESVLKSKAFTEPQELFTEKEQRLDMALKELQEHMQRHLVQKQHSFDVQAIRLNGLNPLGVLGRGYSVATVGEKVLSSVDQLVWGDELKTELADGYVYSVVQSTEKKQNGKQKDS